MWGAQDNTNCLLTVCHHAAFVGQPGAGAATLGKGTAEWRCRAAIPVPAGHHPFLPGCPVSSLPSFLAAHPALLRTVIVDPICGPVRQCLTLHDEKGIDNQTARKLIMATRALL